MPRPRPRLRVADALSRPARVSSPLVRRSGNLGGPRFFNLLTTGPLADRAPYHHAKFPYLPGSGEVDSGGVPPGFAVGPSSQRKPIRLGLSPRFFIATSSTLSCETF